MDILLSHEALTGIFYNRSKLFFSGSNVWKLYKTVHEILVPMETVLKSSFNTHADVSDGTRNLEYLQHMFLVEK